MEDGTPREGLRKPADRFVLACGVFVLLVGAVLLAVADDARSLVSSLSSLVLGLALVLIGPGRTRPRLKAAGIACALLAILLAVVGVVLID